MLLQDTLYYFGVDIGVNIDFGIIKRDGVQ